MRQGEGDLATLEEGLRVGVHLDKHPQPQLLPPPLCMALLVAERGRQAARAASLSTTPRHADSHHHC